jgi:hypothetical protein
MEYGTKGEICMQILRGVRTMKNLMLATMLSLAVAGSLASTSALATDDPHHPAQAATPAGPAPQGAMPMMNMMRMMGMARGAGADTIDRVEGRIAFLRTELKITEAQSTAWNAFADALRTNAQKLGEVRAAMMAQPVGEGQQAPKLGDRLELQERWLLARLEGTRTIRSAFGKLDEVLSDDQKKTAAELLAPHMGMGMMGPMGGQMQPGQMRSNQM